MRSERLRLSVELFAVFASVSLFGTVMISLHNLVILRMPWAAYAAEVLPFKLLIAVLMVVTFQGYARLRLRSAFAPVPADGGSAEAAWNRLYRLPEEAFRLMAAFGMFVSPVYHLADAYMRGNDVWRRGGEQLLQNMLFDQSLSLCLAALLYTGLNLVIRPHLRRLGLTETGGVKPSGYIRMAAFNLLALYLFVMIGTIWFVWNQSAAGDDSPAGEAAVFAASVLSVAAALLAIHALNLRNSLRLALQEFRELLAAYPGRSSQRLTIVSADEFGMLASAFNALQARVEHEYDALNRELELARNVQRKLMPSQGYRGRAVRAAGVCLPSLDVGGDFFDIVELPDGSVAAAIGDVTGKGVQAALTMSAAAAALRVELRRGGTAAEVLGRLNRALCGMLPERVFVTIGLGIFAPDGTSCDYAGAGHMYPYLLRGNALSEIETPSLPVGIDPDRQYRSIRVPLQPGDRLVLYTDGLVETEDGGGMVGFRRFERALPVVEPAEDPERGIELLLRALPVGDRDSRDDRTVVLIVVPDDTRKAL